MAATETRKAEHYFDFRGVEKVAHAGCTEQGTINIWSKDLGTHRQYVVPNSLVLKKIIWLQILQCVDSMAHVVPAGPRAPLGPFGPRSPWLARS